MNTEVMYVEAELNDVLSYYLRGYALTDGRTIIKSEPFIDVLKDKVIFKIVTTDNNN